MIRTDILFNTGVLALLGGGLVQAQSDESVFKFCKKGDCTDCPVGLTTAGTGYPKCVIYNSDDVFRGLEFEPSEGGGYHPYLNIPQPDPTCRIIVKSPANTDMLGCGAVMASFSNRQCAVLNIDQTFMVQFCCGFDDCRAAGAVKVRRDGIVEPVEPSDFPTLSPHAKRSSGGAVMLQYPNGTIIQPLQVGPPAGLKTVKKSIAQPLKKRSCDAGWEPVEGKEDYTRPADNTQIVAREVTGPGEITIAETREQSFTTTMNLGFADIVSFGIGFEMTESKSDSSEHKMSIGEGQSGSVGFTSYMRCSEGRGHCDGEEFNGEVCTPVIIKQNGKDTIDGRYQVIINS
ncbi:hypothetical protein V8F06_009666 [Rhypophila decipiens]